MAVLRRTRKINYTSPIYELDYINYRNKIYNLIIDNNCHIYLDTNILTRLYRIHTSARKEILDWFKGFNDYHIPWWGYNEYIKYSKNKGSLKKLSPFKIDEIKNQLEDQRTQLMLSISDSVLSGTRYSTKQDFFTELETVIEKLINLQKVIKGIDNGSEVTSELSDLLENKILEKPDFLDYIADEFSLRLENKIPPGYDERKKENIIGDFIIFKEICENKTENEIKNVIFITEDKKKDWSYLPDNIIYNGVKHNNNKKNKISDITLPIRIADPRLVNEMNYSKSGDNFFVIDLTLLVDILNEIDEENFKEISKCLVHELNQDIDKPDVEIVEEIENTEETDVSMYKANVIKDSTYNFHNDLSKTDELINKLKSYNWYTQSEAIFYIKSHKFKVLDFTNDELFIIGRNIYQTAVGTERNAVNFMENIEKEIVKFNDDEANNHILNGILFEIFFDGKGVLRRRLKDKFLEEVFNLYPLYEKAFEFIINCLNDNISRFLYLPPQMKDNVKFEIVIDEEENEKNVTYIENIVVNEKELFIIEEKTAADPLLKWSYITDNIYELLYSFKDEKKLKIALSKAFYIPLKNIEIDFNNSKEITYPLTTKENVGINYEIDLFNYLKM